MKITVRLFALSRELVGKNELEFTVAEGANVAQVLDLIRADYPGFRKMSVFMIAVNQEFTERDQVLGDGDEVAIIPPVSGG